jgi:hypothetical protein
MTREPEDFLRVADSSHLTDADWAEINKIKKAYETGGTEALSRAMADLINADPIRGVNVIAAYFPDTVREAIRDSMADLGVTTEDLLEILEKAKVELEGGSTSKH